MSKRSVLVVDGAGNVGVVIRPMVYMSNREAFRLTWAAAIP
jgi:hypothetical protein